MLALEFGEPMEPIEPIDVIAFPCLLPALARGDTMAELWSEAPGCPVLSNPSTLGAFRNFSFETAALLMFL